MRGVPRYADLMISSIGEISRERVFKSSDTLNPHERPFTGMLDCHPRPASGRGGCFLVFLLLDGPPSACSGVGERQ